MIMIESVGLGLRGLKLPLPFISVGSLSLPLPPLSSSSAGVAPEPSTSGHRVATVGAVLLFEEKTIL